MHCPRFEGTRAEMLDIFIAIDGQYVRDALGDPQNIFNILMGHQPVGLSFLSAFKIWAVSCHFISERYRKIFSVKGYVPAHKLTAFMTLP